MTNVYVVAFINEQNEADARLFSTPEEARLVYAEAVADDLAPELFTRFIEDE